VGIIVELSLKPAPGSAGGDGASALSVLNRRRGTVMQAGRGHRSRFPIQYVERECACGQPEEVSGAPSNSAGRSPGANPLTGAADVALLRQGQTTRFGEPLTAGDAARAWRTRRHLLAMD